MRRVIARLVSLGATRRDVVLQRVDCDSELQQIPVTITLPLCATVASCDDIRLWPLLDAPAVRLYVMAGPYPAETSADDLTVLYDETETVWRGSQPQRVLVADGPVPGAAAFMLARTIPRWPDVDCLIGFDGGYAWYQPDGYTPRDASSYSTRLWMQVPSRSGDGAVNYVNTGRADMEWAEEADGRVKVCHHPVVVYRERWEPRGRWLYTS